MDDEIAGKILAIVVGLKADQVIGQHRFHQIAMVRNAFDHIAGGPWRMQEETDRLGHAEVTQLSPQREEMIVLNPERGVGLSEPQQRAGHEGIDFAIGQIIALRNANKIGTRMQRRPQGRIGKALVISAVMRCRQIQHGERAGPERLNFGKRFLLDAVADAAAGTDPNRA